MLRGTRILTCRGTERVDRLSIGDHVVTTRGEKPINVPHSDLYLSPMHAVLIDDVLIEVKDLVRGCGKPV